MAGLFRRKPVLLGTEDLPAGFAYPDELVGLIGSQPLRNWEWLSGERLRKASANLWLHHPRHLVPVAVRNGTTFVVCLDHSRVGPLGHEVVTIDALDDEQNDASPTGSGLAAEKARRLAQLDDLRAEGVAPYPYRFDRTHTVADVRAGWGNLEPGVETEDAVAIAGRIMLMRDSGKLVFATVRDRSGDVQLFISKAVVGDDAFAAIKRLDLGDWVGVHGTVMTTRKGELSVKPESVELLAKAVRPLPDKWHGLTDVDTRFRQRYADLIVNPEAQRAFEIRHEITSSFRRTLHERGFIEVETPVLHVEPGGAHARPFTTHHNALDMPLYLRIALELHLKRLIVGGMERVYEIGRIFRNEGISTRHNPEFTMI